MVRRGTPRARSCRTALVDGQVAGVGAHMLARMVIGGEERRVSFSCHAVTSPAAQRARDLHRAPARARPGGRGAGPRGRARLRQRGDEPGVLRPAALVGRGALPDLGAAGRPAADAMRRARSTPRATQRCAGRTTSSATSGTSLALRRLAAAVRDRSLRQRLRGRRPSKPFGSRTIAVVSDLVAPPKEVPGLLRRAAGAARSRLMFALPAPGQRGAFARAGFVPTHLTMHLIGRGLNGPLDLRPGRLALHARRRGLLLMRLVFVTQQVDPGHPALAATVPMMRALAGDGRRGGRARRPGARRRCCPRTAASGRSGRGRGWGAERSSSRRSPPSWRGGRSRRRSSRTCARSTRCWRRRSPARWG